LKITLLPKKNYANAKFRKSHNDEHRQNNNNSAQQKILWLQQVHLLCKEAT
jgi:hypothetical protein